MVPFVCCGVPRSGSTLVWQTLQAVFPEYTAPQDHPGTFEPDGKTTAIITIRDPRDVAASRYRIRLSRDPSTGDLPGLQSELHYMDFTFFGIKRVQAGGPSCLLRYEEFFYNRDVIYDAIVKMGGRCVGEQERERINHHTSLEANRARASKLISFLEMDEMKIHGDHVGKHPAPGGWRNSLPLWAHAYVENHCYDLCEEWGYEVG